MAPSLLATAKKHTVVLLGPVSGVFKFDGPGLFAEVRAASKTRLFRRRSDPKQKGRGHLEKWHFEARGEHDLMRLGLEAALGRNRRKPCYAIITKNKGEGNKKA